MDPATSECTNPLEVYEAPVPKVANYVRLTVVSLYDRGGGLHFYQTITGAQIYLSTKQKISYKTDIAFLISPEDSVANVVYKKQRHGTQFE